MLDVLGGITLTVMSVVAVGALVVAGGGEGARRGRLAWIAAVWFGAIALLASRGAFATPGSGVFVLGATILAPIVIGVLAFANSRAVRSFALGLPTALLVALHGGRFIGGFFLALYGAGKLPPTFALTAGWGDLLVATLAIPMAWSVRRGLNGSRALLWAWSAFGLADLVTAVSLAVGSTADFPGRFIFETPDPGAVARLPWALIPGFLVPLLLLTHLVVIAQLVGSARSERHESLARAA